jgi:hypothetical protein
MNSHNNSRKSSTPVFKSTRLLDQLRERIRYLHYSLRTEECDLILSQFSRQRSRAIARYVAFVREGKGLPSVWNQLQGQVFLGSEAFVEKMQAMIDKRPTMTEVPRAQRRALVQDLAHFAQKYERNEAIARAYLSGRHTMAAIAKYFDIHYTTVSRLVRAHEAQQRK